MNHQEIQEKWQRFWEENQTFKAEGPSSKKPKYYVLDMFPYPSGAGLHVGHPLGYIASDIMARYKRLQGYNVLHPMGFDSFGLPAEQYAIQTGQHPKITTEVNADTYRKQLKKIGLSFDWSREFKTSDPSYYRWTQWIFLQLFNLYYDVELKKASPISHLQKHFALYGSKDNHAFNGHELSFTPHEWKQYSSKQQEDILQKVRLVYQDYQTVNWCEALGTVLANDEVKEGLSVRGNHSVVQKKMMQWNLRITAYAERLLHYPSDIHWPKALMEMQQNWIGRSQGLELTFSTELKENLDVFTTRPETLYGVTFMVVAPEHPLVQRVKGNKELQEFLQYVGRRSERERLSEKNYKGVFLGFHATHPLTKKKIPIYTSEYVLMNYGTGAVMAVPGHDERDKAFAEEHQLPIISVIDEKTQSLINSENLNGLSIEEATKEIIKLAEEEEGFGKSSIQYKLRDASFSRQRYWGEPIPVYFKEGIPTLIEEKDLPLELPDVDEYLPTSDGRPPLARAKNFHYKNHPLEVSTMPGYAGSSSYFLRFMDPHNQDAFLSLEAMRYWQEVDLYVGGSEHATGHLLYSRFWNMVLFDLGIVEKENPFKKIVNQGMILGKSSLLYRTKEGKTFVTAEKKDEFDTVPLHVDISLVDPVTHKLDIENFKKWRSEYASYDFILNENKDYICGQIVEKMSKSFYNIVSPDTIVQEYGADTLRLFEMFLGPIDASKPWNQGSIEGPYRFIQRVQRLFLDDKGNLIVTKEVATVEEKKILHKTLKKIAHDIEKFSFNTAVGQLMIFVNEMYKLSCHKEEILKPFLLCLSSFAPHLCEELLEKLGEKDLRFMSYPAWDEELTQENTFELPVSFNGKRRFSMEVPLNITQDEVMNLLQKDDRFTHQITGKTIKKIIFVPQKILNIVIS